MHVLLEVPFANTSVHSLGYSLGQATVCTLASLVVPCPAIDGTIELGILGASHQITVRNARDETIGVETLACTVAAAVPPVTATLLGGLPYQFICRVREVTPSRLDTMASTIVRTLAAAPHGVVATFPREPQAITGILLDSIPPSSISTNPFQLRWRSWHLYPSERTVVSTLTRLTVRYRSGPVAPEILGTWPKAVPLPLGCDKNDAVRVSEGSARRR